MRSRLHLWPIFALVCLLLPACAPSKKPATPFDTAMEHRARGEFTEYRRALEHELTIRPGNLDARYNLAILLEDAGHIDDAKQLYEENLRRGHHLPSAINLALLLRRKGDSKAAEQLLLQTAAHFKREATPWYLLADISSEKKRVTEANERFGKAISADPHNGFARLYYARFLSKQGRLKEAEQEGNKAVQLLPDCAPCWRSLGDILKHSGKKKGALAAYQRSLAIEPDNRTRQKLIDTLQAMGQNERARLMQKALNAWRQTHPD